VTIILDLLYLSCYHLKAVKRFKIELAWYFFLFHHHQKSLISFFRTLLHDGKLHNLQIGLNWRKGKNFFFLLNSWEKVFKLLEKQPISCSMLTLFISIYKFCQMDGEERSKDAKWKLREEHLLCCSNKCMDRRSFSLWKIKISFLFPQTSLIVWCQICNNHCESTFPQIKACNGCTTIFILT